jgi:hypothetical protein
MLIVGEWHLSTVLAEYMRHDNGQRPHRALHLQPPRPNHPSANTSTERIKRRSVLGGEGLLIFRIANPLGFVSEREDVIVWEAAVVYSRV